MGWILRDNTFPTPGKPYPDYGSNSDFFTIRMHHSGQFFNLGKTCYTGEFVDISHIDYCHPDEMSLVELKNMANELNLKAVKAFHYSVCHINDCTSLLTIRSDNAAMNLVNVVDSDRMVGVFVEHEADAPYSTARGLTQLLPDIDEPPSFVGDFVENYGTPMWAGQRVNNDVIDSNDIDDVQSIGTDSTDDVQSIGTDSTYSDDFVNSDSKISDDDDVLFDEHVDSDVEWGGLDLKKSYREGHVIKSGECSRRRDEGDKRSQKLDIEDPIFYIGMEFVDSATFRKYVRQHSIKHGRDVKFPINDRLKVQAKCKNKMCPWVIYASKVQGEDTITVKTYVDKHKCPRQQKVSHANARWLANLYGVEISTNPSWPIDSMMTVMKKDVKLHFNKWLLYKTKKIVSEKGSGTDAEQFAMLWSYAEEIRRTNPGTNVKIKCKQVEGQPQFKRLYICWAALKKGFLEGCTPVIFLDGCHLKSVCGGILLTAVGMDGNNGLFPFAYAVVEKEKQKSWLWFLRFLVEGLNIINNSLWTIMSDKQKGLIDAVPIVLPGCEHRFCVMHLYKNFKATHKGLALKTLLWKAARSTRAWDFEKTMKDLRDRDIGAYEWLSKRPPINWSRAYFSTHPKTDILVNNMSESFNSMLLMARNRPIVTMLEMIRLKLMKRIYTRRDKMEKYDEDICPFAVKMLEEVKKKSMEFIAHWNGHEQFEIEGIFGAKFKVNLGERTCSCRKWELTGIPCAHAISGIYFMGYTPEEYVDEYYSKEKFMKAYNNLMGTLDDPSMWPKVEIQPVVPPVCQKFPGRPKKHNRRKEADEVKKNGKKSDHVHEIVKKNGKEKDVVQRRLSKKGVVMTCSICKHNTHNARTCPLRSKKSQAKEGHEVPPWIEEVIKDKKRKELTCEVGETNKTAPTRSTSFGLQGDKVKRIGVEVNASSHRNADFFCQTVLAS